MVAINERGVVLITGVSGAGKTTAMDILEDMGYHCTDNFPVQLLESLEKIINTKPDPCYSNIALAAAAIDYPKFLQCFGNIDVDVCVVFPDAPSGKLLLRYRFTRRHHPMIVFSKADTLEEAIEAECDMSNTLNEHAVLHVDTIIMDQHGLKGILMEKLSLSNKPVFSVSFISFGFKYGVSMDVDLVFDVRFLPNPYCIEELHEQAGDDAPVYDYVTSFDQTKEFVRHLKSFLGYVFIQYKNERENHLTVGIDCIGGHHRSVFVTNWLCSHHRGQYYCYGSHRDEKAG